MIERKAQAFVASFDEYCWKHHKRSKNNSQRTEEEGDRSEQQGEPYAEVFKNIARQKNVQEKSKGCQASVKETKKSLIIIPAYMSFNRGTELEINKCRDDDCNDNDGGDVDKIIIFSDRIKTVFKANFLGSGRLFFWHGGLDR